MFKNATGRLLTERGGEDSPTSERDSGFWFKWLVSDANDAHITGSIPSGTTSLWLSSTALPAPETQPAVTDMHVNYPREDCGSVSTHVHESVCTHAGPRVGEF